MTASIINGADRDVLCAELVKKFGEIHEIMGQLRRETLAEEPTGPLTLKQSQKRAERDQGRRDRIKDVQSTAAIKVGGIQKKMGS